MGSGIGLGPWFHHALSRSTPRLFVPRFLSRPLDSFMCVNNPVSVLECLQAISHDGALGLREARVIGPISLIQSLPNIWQR